MQEDDQPSADTAASVAAAGGGECWTSLRALWWSAGLLAVLLGVVLTAVDVGVPTVLDESVYAEQAEALAAGSWWSERPAPDIDREGLRAPLIDSIINGDRLIAYNRHPLYPLLLTLPYRWGGYSGALAVSAAGLWAASVVAGFCARRLDSRLGIPAMWVAATTSPLLFNGFVLWAHTLAAASAGLTYLSIVRSLDGRRRWLHLASAAFASVLTVLLRSEGILFVLALATVVGAASLRIHGRWRLSREGMSTAIGLALVGVVAYRVDGLWSRSIGGGGGYGSDASSLVLSDRTNPASFVWGSLLRPYRYDWIGREFVIAATVLVVLAALAIRIAPRRPVVPWALSTVAAVLWIIDLVTVREVATTMITGLFPAFPLLLAALVLVGRQDLRSRDTSIAGATFVLGAAALVLTSYGSGGSTEWGGRYLNVFLVPLVGPAMTIVLRRRPVFSESELRLLGVPLAVLLLALPVAAVAWVGGRARQIGPQMKRLEITATAESGAPSRPLAIVWRSSADGMSRRLWVVRDRIDALHLNEFRMLAGLLNRAAAAGHRVVVLVSDVPLAVFPLLATPTLDDARWKLDEGASWADGDIAVFVLRIGSPEAERENPLDG